MLGAALEPTRTHRKHSNRSTACGRDYLSALPLELFFVIASHIIDNVSTTPRTALKTLSLVSKEVRSKCISAGLFESLLIMAQHGLSRRVRTICYKLNSKTILPNSVHELTIGEQIIRECPSELARLLQLVPHVRILRITGSRRDNGPYFRESHRPLICGRLISFSGILYKTLTSQTYLPRLEHIEVINLSMTQIMFDILAAIPQYSTLTLSGCLITEYPDPMMATKLCKVSFLHLKRNYASGDEARLVDFLANTNIGRKIKYLTISTSVLGNLLLNIPRRNSRFEAVFPRLETLNIFRADLSYYARHVRERISVKRLVWKVNSFAHHNAYVFVSVSRFWF